MHRASGRPGMTLVEVVVLVCLVLVAFSLVLPAIHAAQIFARRAHTANNLKLIGLAIHNYESANGIFPMSAVASENEKDRGVGHSGFTALLPYLEYVRPYNMYNFDLEPWDESNSTSTRTRVDVYLATENKQLEPTAAGNVLTLDGKGFPGRNAFGPLHFGMNWGGGHEGFGDDFVKAKGKYVGLFMTVMSADGRKLGARNVRIADVTDGLSNTLAVVEKRGSSGWAVGGFGGSEFDVFTSSNYDGNDATAQRVLTGASNGAGPRALVSDGSVRTTALKLAKATWYALLTRAGGEAIPDDALSR